MLQLKITVFSRNRLVCTNCFIGTERLPETSVNADYANKPFSQAYAEHVT